MSIRVVNIKKLFRRFVALDNVSIDVQPGEFLALLGPSGSGKTTLLRIIAGLEFADSGQIFQEGESTTKIPLKKRNVGFVFQHYALFRHMTVFDNVAFGLRVKAKHERPSEQEIKIRVTQLLKLVHLEGFHRQYPSQLSGGQRQRVALARVLAIEPKVMLLDEPFGALDAKVRKELRRWLRRLHDETKITTIFVTHDQEEAMEIADRVAVMEKGNIVQIGTPEEIWRKPRNSFVYDFLGNYNEFLGFKDEAGDIHICANHMIVQAQQEIAKASVVVEKPPTRWDKFLRWLGIVKERPKKLPESEPITSMTPHQKYVKLFSRPFELSLSKHPPEGED